MNQNYFFNSYQPKNLRELPCAVCNAQENSLIRLENQLQIGRCVQCGYVYVNPRPSVADLGEFYSEYYVEGEGLAESWGGEMSLIFSSAYKRISASRNSGRILDVGSSYGHFLSQFDSSCWEATGVDPSATAIAYSRDKYPHIAAHAANFEDVQLAQNSFDVITSFYVLEHVFDPRETMQRIHALLADGGLALIRIPYTRPFFPIARMLGRPLMYAPMHLNDFAPQHFERMCRDIGFSQATSSIGARRNSSDTLENLGAAVFSSIGRLYEALTRNRHRFPYAGAYTYELRK